MTGKVGATSKTSSFWFLFFICVLALIYRLDFLVASNFRVDSDEAIVGLMAKHINEGSPIPVFYYGQDYMGSLEPLLASVSFSLLGVSSFALKLVPLLVSLILILVFYEFLRIASNTAVARIGAILMAIPAPTLVIWSAKARGGFIEVLLLGALASLWFFKWLQSQPKDWNYFYGSALILGVGWWVNNQIVYFMMPVGIFSLVYWIYRFTWSSLGHIFVAFVAFFIGGAPYWIYNLAHDFASFKMFTTAESGGFAEHFVGFYSTALPILLGAKRYWQTHDIVPYASVIVFSMYGFLLFGLLIAALRYTQAGVSLKSIVGISQGNRPSTDFVRLLSFMTLFLAIAVIIFCSSSFGHLVAAPRYLLPLYIGVFSLLAVGIGSLRAPWRQTILAAFLAVHLVCAFYGTRAIPGEPFVYKGERVAKSHSQLIAWLRSRNIEWVRTNYWIGYRLAFETNEQIRFAVFQRPYQIRIDEYQRTAESSRYAELPLVLTPAQAKIVRTALEVQGYVFKEIALDGYVVYYDIHPMHTLGSPLRISEDQLQVSSGEDLKAQLVDGDKETRWGTGLPQKQNMFVEVRFDAPQNLEGLAIDLGMWTHDFPRGLRIEFEGAFGIRTLVDADQYQAIRYLREDEPKFTLFFSVDGVRVIRLVQTEGDEFFDWSIAELEVY